ncbi:MAG: IS1182 family transposase [Actinomycetota bacterium]|nr:IS1182 family transposase [Actinomycetota bacterium]
MGNNFGDDALFEVGDDGERSVVRVPAGRSKVFRRYDPGQSFLMPPSLDDWLPEDHTARFVSEMVDEMLDLSAVFDSYVSASGAPPYDPVMMLKVLFYAYSTGVTSSREMERRCHVDVAFRWLAANTAPDYRSIARFRRRHLAAVDDLFIQVLVLCSEAGLVKLGRVALDGTKLRASASRRKAMSYGRLGPRIEQIQAEVAAILAEAEATDLAEDEEFGEDKRGDEVPPELARRETRLVKLRAAKEAIEAEAAEKAAAKAADRAEKDGADDAGVAEATATAAAGATPADRAQRSFTDPEARMMKTNDGFHYAYNAQAVVDERSQVVLAANVTDQAGDVQQLIPMIDAAIDSLAEAGIDAAPDMVLADAGYCSEDNLDAVADTKIDVLVATGRIRHNERVPDTPRGPIPKDATRRERMARRLRTKPGRADYARRKAIVEPVFGQMKVRQHAGHLRLRGLAGAQGEWTLHAICHNLRKLANAADVANRVPAAAT